MGDKDSISAKEEFDEFGDKVDGDKLTDGSSTKISSFGLYTGIRLSAALGAGVSAVSIISVEHFLKLQEFPYKDAIEIGGVLLGVVVGVSIYMRYVSNRLHKKPVSNFNNPKIS